MNIRPMKALMTAAAVICLMLMVYHFVLGIFTGLRGIQHAAIGMSFMILFLIGRKSLADAEEVGSGKFCRYTIMLLLGMSVLNILLINNMNHQILNQLVLIFIALYSGIILPGGPMPKDDKE